MAQDKQYLNDLKESLSHYKKQLASTGNSFKEKGDKRSEKVLHQLNESYEEAGEAYDKLKSATSEEWDKLKKIAHKAFEDLKYNFNSLSNDASGQLQDYARYLEEEGEEIYDSTLEYIQNHPVKSVLIAAAAGLIIGRILK